MDEIKSISDLIANPAKLRELLGWVNEMQRLRILTNTGGALLRRSPATKSYTLDTRGTEEGALPAVAGQADKFLTNDGVTTSWGDPPLPVMTDVAFNAANFTGNGSLVWTLTDPDQVVFAYTLLGRIMTVYLVLDATSVSGSGFALQIKIPGGKTASRNLYGPIAIVDNGTYSTGLAQVVAGTTIYIYKDISGTNWSASTNNTDVRGMLQFEVNA